MLTTQDREMLDSHGNIIEEAYPALEVTSRCIPDHPKGVHDDRTEETAAPLVVDLAVAFELDGYDAVVVSCAGDPGVRMARRKLRIPVIGAGSATAAVALGLGGGVGVLGIMDDAPSAMASILGDRIVGCVRPEGVRTTIDLLSDEGRNSVNEAALSLKRKGAEVIALGCTGLSTIQAAAGIRASTGLAVVDPVLAEGLLLYYALRSIP